jgi:RNA polymerase sigma factor (sigma-70 family)
MERHNGRLYRVARGVVRNDSEAEDVVQESYMRAFSKLATFRGDASLATWLTRIVLNEALGRLRRRRPTAELDAVDKIVPTGGGEIVWFPGAASDMDPERAASRREIAGLLERAIDELPEIFRVVFVMRAVEEMSGEETADAFVRQGLKKIAAYRDDRGKLHLRSAACTHAGCLVHWNAFERCWDCTCHGSQFSVDGEPLNAPAFKALAKMDS